MGFLSSVVKKVKKVVKKADQEVRKVRDKVESNRVTRTVAKIAAPLYYSHKDLKKAVEDKNWSEAIHIISTGSPGVDEGLKNVGVVANKKTDGGLVKVNKVAKPAAYVINPVAGTIVTNAANRADMEYYKDKYGLTDKEASEAMMKKNILENAIGWGTYGVGSFMKGFNAANGAGYGSGGVGAGASQGATSGTGAGVVATKTAVNASSQAARQPISYSSWTGKGGEQAVANSGKGLVYGSPEYMKATSELGMNPNIGVSDYWYSLPQETRDAIIEASKSGVKGAAEDLLPSALRMFAKPLQQMVGMPEQYDGWNVSGFMGNNKRQGASPFNATGMNTRNNWNPETLALGDPNVEEMQKTQTRLKQDMVYNETPLEEKAREDKEKKLREMYTFGRTPAQEYYDTLA